MMHKTNQSPFRRGAATLELLTAGVLLATVSAFLVPFLGQISLVNEDIADRKFALREVQRIIVEMQSGVKNVELSEAAHQRLESPTLDVETAPASEENLQQVNVSLAWVNQYGETVSPTSLTFWKPAEVSQ